MQKRLYKDLAWLWPIISPPEEYIKETKFFCEIIKKHSKIKVKTLLHLGCGGGHNDSIFKKHFQVTGIDLSPEMLKLAKKLNPKVRDLKGDMRTLRLKEQFDAVVCPDSIAYMLTPRDLGKAFKTAYEHLKPGGIFLTLIEENKKDFRQNKTYCEVHRKKDIEVTYIENHYDPNPKDTNFEVTFIYLIRHKGRLRIETDRHVCGLFHKNTWLSLLQETGFEVRDMKFKHPIFEKGFCPMLVCQKTKKKASK